MLAEQPLPLVGPVDGQAEGGLYRAPMTTCCSTRAPPPPYRHGTGALPR